MASWLFQSNPELFDLASAIKALDEQTWLVNQHAKAIHAGDKVFFWETGKNAGIIGVGTILSEPTEIPEDPAEATFTRQPDKFAGTRLRVRVRTDHVLEPRLAKEQILGSSVLNRLPNIAFAHATNSPLKVEQEQELQRLIDNPPPAPVISPKPGVVPPGAITLERTGELLQSVLAYLNEHGPTKVGDLLRQLPGVLKLSDYELSRNNSGVARWETAVRWYAMSAARAGWLSRESGVWSITSSGVQALTLSPMEFITQ